MNTSMTLLGLVGHGSSYGYDLKKDYDNFFGLKKPIAFGQIYATLSRMVRDGFIASMGDEAGGGPDRKKYEITPKGVEQVKSWMYTPQLPEGDMRSELFAKTVIALLLSENAEELLDIQRSTHLSHMRRLTRQKQHADLATVLLYDHALFHLEADLRWIDLTSARINTLRKELVHA